MRPESSSAHLQTATSPTRLATVLAPRVTHWALNEPPSSHVPLKSMLHGENGGAGMERPVMTQGRPVPAQSPAQPLASLRVKAHVITMATEIHSKVPDVSSDTLLVVSQNHLS